MTSAEVPQPTLLDTLALAFRIPSTQDGESGVLVPQGGQWWLICPAAATFYVSADDDFEDCNDPTCEWIEDVHARAGQVARIMAATTPANEEVPDSPVHPDAERAAMDALDSALRPVPLRHACFCEPVAQGRIHLRGADCEIAANEGAERAECDICGRSGPRRLGQGGLMVCVDSDGCQSFTGVGGDRG